MYADTTTIITHPRAWARAHARARIHVNAHMMRNRETEKKKKKKKEKQIEKKHRACFECFLKRRNSDESPVTESSVDPMMLELDAGGEPGEDAAAAAGVGLLAHKVT